LTPQQRTEWDRLIQVRNEVNRHLEQERAEKKISSSLGASVCISAPSPLYEQLKQRESFLPTFFIVSQVDLKPMNHEKSLSIAIQPARGIKCERCWIYREEVGHNNDHPTLCQRCCEVVARVV